ncbi:MAG: DUF1232 domain-containing protein [Bacteroidales bacterium]|nr:DUF1232 domain-containing protein [Bacteroidales bacterium]
MEDRTRDSRSYKKAWSKAEDYIRDPGKLGRLIDDATGKAGQKSGPLKNIWNYLMACFRLIKAYANGSYRNISWQSLVMIVASIIYFVMPFDLIPDFLPGFGLLDDAAILAWTIRAISADVDAFVEWEAKSA